MGKKSVNKKKRSLSPSKVTSSKVVTDSSHVQETVLARLASLERQVSTLTDDNSRHKRNEERQSKVIHDLRLENKRLKSENAKLRKRLGNDANPPKDSSNSSVPPSKDSIRSSCDRVKRTQSLREKSTRHVGGQTGHKGVTLHQSAHVDKTVGPVLGTCPSCGCSLRNAAWALAERRQVIDILFPMPVVTEYHSFETRCPGCGKKIRTPFPEGVNSPVCYGPNIKAFVAYLSEAQFVPAARVTEILRDVFGVGMSKGTVCNIIQKVKEAATPTYKLIHDLIAKEKVVGADETGENINGALKWLWTFQSARLTYLAGGKGRGMKDFESEYPDGLPDVNLVTDRLEVYHNVVVKGHQICLAHLLRNLEYLNQLDTGQDWSKRMQELFRDAIRQRKTLDWLDIRRSDIERRFDDLLNEPLDNLGKEFGQLQKSLRKWRDAVFAFLYNPDLPSDNNGSERAIRKTKIKMKVSQCFRSDKGESAFAVLHSLMDTAKKNGQSAFNVLKTITTNGVWMPPYALKTTLL